MVRIMADNHTKEIRSMNMSHIRSKDTKPEIIVRSFLHKNGFRFRKNDKRYPGKPDIVLPRYKTAVYINGCFWHMHNCNNFVWPKSNIEYWTSKLFQIRLFSAELRIHSISRLEMLFRQCSQKQLLNIWQSI